MATKKSVGITNKTTNQGVKSPSGRTNGVKTASVAPGGAKVAKTRNAKTRTTTAKVVPLQATIHSRVMSNGQTRAKRRS